MKKAAIFALTIATAVVSLFSATQMPFPQQKSFDNCVKPSLNQDILNDDVKKAYDLYKQTYKRNAVSTSGAYYYQSEDTDNTGVLTVSEQHGYAMIITCIMAGYDAEAKTIFDGLVKFYEAHKSDKNDDLMSWNIWGAGGGEGFNGSSSATDGDMDIAYALIMAWYQWGETSYKDKAIKIIDDIKASNINYETNMITMGNYVGTGGHYYFTRPSDWMAGHFRLFATVDSDPIWNTLATNVYSVYNKFLTANGNSSTGLISDFVQYYGGDSAWTTDPATQEIEGSNDNKMWMNACRVPLRFAADYAHYGNSSAKSAINKMSSWVKSETSNDPKSIGTGYYVSGGGINGSANAVFTGPLVASCINGSSNQQYLTDGWNWLNSGYLNGNDSYQMAVRILSMMLISGNWWAPGDGATDIIEDDVDPKFVLFDDFKNKFDDVNAQAHLGAAYGNSNHNNKDSAFTGGSYWYVYGDDNGSKITGDGATITGDNADKIVSNSVMDVAITKNSKDGSFIVLESSILGDGSQWFDFTDLSWITMKAKGTGRVRVALLTQDISSLSADDSWGYYGFEINLTDEWMWHNKKKTLLAPQSGSYASNEGWDWDHGKTKVKAISITPVTSDVDMQLDSIRFHGLEYKSDFGFDYKEPITVVDTGNVNDTVSGDYVLFEDFANKFSDANSQSHLGAAAGMALEGIKDSAHVGGSFWYTYADSKSSVKSGPTAIGDDNADDMVDNKEMNVTFTKDASDGAYVGIESAILGDGSDLYDFSELTGLALRVKGSGKVRVELITDDIASLGDNAWGYYGFDMNLSSSYQWISKAPESLEPAQYSPAADSGWSWNHGKTKVKAISIAPVDNDVDLVVDSILFYGMEYKRDFGFTYKEPNETAIVEGNSFANSIGGAFMSDAGLVMPISITETTPVKAELFSVQGRSLGVVGKSLDAGSHALVMPVQTNHLAGGMYILRIQVGNMVTTEQIRL